MRIVLITILLMSCNLIASYLNETATMDSTTFRNLYNAIDTSNGHDEAMRYYWERFKAGSTPNPAAGNLIGMAAIFAKNALIGSLRVDMEVNEARTYLNGAKDYLIYNQARPSYYLNLSNVWSTYIRGTFSDCLSYGSLLQNVAFITDILWLYVTPEEQQILSAKLEELAGWAYELLSYEDFDGGNAFARSDKYPEKLWISYHNGRFILAGALGYAGVVLKNRTYIDTAEADLFERPLPRNASGFVEYMTTNSGTYGESMSYTEYALQGLTMFLVARKRMNDGKDWFQDDRIRTLYVNSLHLVSPTMVLMPFGDVFETYMRSWKAENVYGKLYLPRNAFSESITYFYQSPAAETEARNLIKWIVNGYIKQHNYYPPPWSLNKFYAYEYDAERILTGESQPSRYLTDGIYSNEEYTIFRRQIHGYEDYNEFPVLIINHENTVGYTEHVHADQSSFILYYKGKQLLIDPGYRPSWQSYNIAREWLASPFAHNLIMVNPHDEWYKSISDSPITYVEEEELTADFWNLNDNYDVWNDTRNTNPNHVVFKYKSFEPIGVKESNYAEMFLAETPQNPAYKNYLISNGSVSHLQIELVYDHPQEYYPPDKRYDIITVRRNFYALDLESNNPYFIIFDEVKSSDHDIENQFMNQLHFSLYPHPENNEYPGLNDNLNDPSTSDGIFTYSHFEGDTFLHGVMGSLGNAVYTVRDSLPQGLYYGRIWGDSEEHPLKPPQWVHKCLRTFITARGNESFFTLFIPSEEETNPVDYVRNSANGYGVKFDANNDDQYKTYAAIGNGSKNFDFPQDQIKFLTDAEFFLLEINESTQHIKKLILNSGKDFQISYFDPDIKSIFSSDDYFQEVIATYDEGNLTTIFKTEHSCRPKFVILRSGVEPQNFKSSTYTRNEYHDHVLVLAYDDKYFYVNYTFSELVAEGLLDSGVMIYDGLYREVIEE